MIAVALTLLTTAWLSTACASGSPAASASPAVTVSGDFAGMIPIGSGRSLYLECSGAGSPTVVLVSGAGVAADNWSYVGSATSEVHPAVRSVAAVYPQIAKRTRVCAYDRPGTKLWDGEPGRSTPVSQPTTTQADADDLHALLASAGVAAPYLIVAHSLGGLIATTYARMYPTGVTGLVLIDPGSQYQQTVLPPAVWTTWMTAIASNVKAHPDAETPDYPASITALSTIAPVPAVPAVVLTADQPFDYLGIGDTTTYWPQWIKAQDLLAKALHAKHITATHAGHFIGVENPALVIGQICAVMAPARTC